MRHYLKTYFSGPGRVATLLFIICGPVFHFSLLLWGHSAPSSESWNDALEIYFTALSFQPSVFFWLAVCAPFVVWLGLPSLLQVWRQLQSERAWKRGFVIVNVSLLLVILGFDLTSGNVMPYEVQTDALETKKLENNRTLLAEFRTFKVGGGSHPESFGREMAQFVYQPEKWSMFRAIYYFVLLTGWAIMLLMVSTSMYVVHACHESKDQQVENGMVRKATQLLGAAIPALPYVVFRQINHLNKEALYGQDFMELADWFLWIVLTGCVVGLLLSAYALAKRLQAALSILMSLGTLLLFVNPDWPAEVLFDGTRRTTLMLLVGIPAVLLLMAWPWLISERSGVPRPPRANI